MRSLVTGACGFVGSHMVDALLREGDDVRATDLPGADRGYLNRRAEFIAADVADAQSLRGLLAGIQRVFHVAALFDYSRSFVDLYRVNVGGTLNLLREAARSGVVERVVVWGAAAVYGDFRNCPVREDAPPNPLNDYAKTKWIQEAEALAFGRERGVQVTVLRPASIYGPRQRYGLFASFKMIALGQNPPFLVDTADNRVSLVHVEDVTGAAAFLSRESEAAFEVYNVADDGGYTLADVTRFMGEHLDWPFYRWPRIPFSVVRATSLNLIRRFKKKGRRPPVDLDMVDYLRCESFQDNSKLKALGYALRHPLPWKGLQENIEWYRKEGWLPA